MNKKLIETIDFLKKLFGNDFILNGLSSSKDNILNINNVTDNDLEIFFTCSLSKQYIFYDTCDGILYSYRPENDWFFKKAVTNAWDFNAIFKPIYWDNWGYWWRHYTFKIYGKEISRNYKLINIID